MDNLINDWELVTQSNCHGKQITERLKVPGGFLYQNVEYDNDDVQIIGSSMCFVPDVDLTRYQAHLRDAYNAGFKDGKEEAMNGLKHAKMPTI